MPVVYDPNNAAVRADPYPLYARLRSDDPVHWSTALKSWIVTRYDDVQRMALAPELSVDKFTPFYQALPEVQRVKVADLIHYLSRWLVFRDPPDHTRLRLLLQRAFTPRAMDSVRPNVEHVTAHLLDTLAEESEVDLVAAFTALLPAYVIMDMLGVPRERFRDMKTWSEDMQLFVGSAQGIPDKYERARRGILGMAELFRGLVAERRARPCDDILTTMVTARDDAAGAGRASVLDDDELVASCILFLFAGHETTTHLLGNATLMLLRDGAARDAFTRHEGAVAPAIEEFLRFDGPIKSFARAALRNHEIGGREIKSGDRLFAMVGAANRDPSQFAAAEHLDLERTPNRHVTFGAGIHFCLGAPLARMEAQIAMPALHRRYPHMQLAREPAWLDSMIMRGLGDLHVRLGPRS